MKILGLNFNQKGVGTYRRSFYFSRELARAGHEVTMMTVAKDSKFRRRVSYKRDWIGETYEPSGTGPWIRLIESPCWGYRFLPGWGSGPLDIWERITEIIEGQYDAVVGFEHHPNVSWPVYMTRGWKQFKFVSDWCDWYAGASNQFRGIQLAHKIDAFLEENIRQRAHRTSVTSRVLYDRALSIGISTDRLKHIPEGAATDYIIPQDKAEARRRVNLPLDAPILAAVRNGDMCREVRIFAEVLRRIPKALLVTVGKVSLAAAELAERRGVGRSILNMGWVSDEEYPTLLSCADVLYCPLEDVLVDRARWPAKILDYLSAGRPVVTNPVGEVECLFRTRNVGTLAPHSDQEFAEALALLLKDGERCRGLGESARRVMVKEWDWRTRSDQISWLVAN
jgi:glycosyltransferase involved in cell wall biosynthesis